MVNAYITVIFTFSTDLNPYITYLKRSLK